RGRWWAACDEGSAAARATSSRRQRGDELVHHLGHLERGAQIEGVDRDENADTARRRESGVAESALQPAGLLQDQRTVAAWHHHHPAQAHRVHVAGFVEAEDWIEPFARQVG